MMNTKQCILSSIWFFGLMLLDRGTKSMALGMLKPYVITSFFEFQLVFNRGISWGMLHFNNQHFFIMLTLCIIGIIAALACYTYKRYAAGYYVYAEGMVLAGAISNVLDRIWYHGVIDFIHVHIGDWSWPIFNVADMAIVLGICWMIKEQSREL